MSELLIVGWREWIALPDLGLPAICCKIDTGAATSAIHVGGVEAFERQGKLWARFVAEPFHNKERKVEVVCEAPVVDEREITSSSGHVERRVVVQTLLRLGFKVDAPSWPIELTLADRTELRFPMLLGRQAMGGRVLVDSGTSNMLGKPVRPRDFYR